MTSKILLVDDDELNRDMLSRRLELYGFAVLQAVDGPEGLDRATTEAPDLILMDMSLPGLDGWETTRRLKADGKTQSVPVIALTAHAMPSDQQKAVEAGCDDFETKPVDFQRLLVKMAALLARRKPPIDSATTPSASPQS